MSPILKIKFDNGVTKYLKIYLNKEYIQWKKGKKYTFGTSYNTVRIRDNDK